MTVIVYRDGVMAADTGGDVAGAVHRWARKLAKAADGTLYGVGGAASEAHELLAWVDAGCEGDMPKPRDTGDGSNSFIIMRAAPSAAVEIIDAHGTERFMPSAAYVVMGAAREVALGALWAGASAEQAVRACLEHSACVHGDVVTIR